MPLRLLYLLLLSVPSFGSAQQGIDSMTEAQRLELIGTREGKVAAAQIWYDLEDTERATRLYQSVLKNHKEAVIVDSIAGLAYHKLGLMAYDTADNSSAIVNYRSAIAIRDQVFPGPHNDRARSRFDAATSLRFLGKLAEASRLIREASTIYAQVPEVDSLDWLKSLNELGKIAGASKDNRIAYSSSFRAVELLEEIGRDNLHPDDVFLTYYTAASVLGQHEELDYALKYGREALISSRETSHGHDAASAHNLLGSIHDKRGEPRASYRQIRQAIDLMEAEDDYRISLGNAYVNLVKYYGGQKNYARSIEYSEKAKMLFLADNDPSEIAHYYLSDKLPFILHRLGRHEEAFDTLAYRLRQLDLLELTHGVVASNFFDSKFAEKLDLLELRAKLLNSMNRGKAALESYRLLFRLQDSLRHQIDSEDSRRYLSRDLRPLFDRAIGLCYRQYHETQDQNMAWRAFELSERARTYSLLTAREQTRGEASLEELRLRKKIADLERKVNQGDGSARTPLEEARIQLDLLSSSKSAMTTFSDSAESRDSLLRFLQGRNTYLLAYHLSNTVSLSFLIDPDGQISLHPIAQEVPLSGLVSEWRRAIAASKYREKSLAADDIQQRLDQQYLVPDRQLRDVLLPQSLLKLISEGKARRLCIVPDGVLHYLPFAALLTRDPAPGFPLDYSSLPYLTSRVELSFAYSTRLLLEQSKAPNRTYRRDLVVFAPSYGAAVARGGSEGPNTTLSPLRDNLEEVEQIVERLSDTRIFLGDSASLSSFFHNASHARILHLPGHARMSAFDPSLSFIAFAQPQDTLLVSERLYFHDLYRLSLDNELTVLSACETSLGEMVPGGPVSSIASAFAAAGSRSTLTTLWEVDDRATKELMVDFYERLTMGEPRAAALQEAQVAHLLGGEFAHPYYWSGVMLYGATGSLPLAGKSSRPNWYWMIGAFAAIIMMGYLFLGRRNR